ncbi:hypothetical protein [Deinococcus aquatilis]|uniref:hypothetical protein n=1 Tax=Deinococcus aquatilis TaxID=519440 RepID=UPI00039CDC55|nr:hypothetical protein [Deinococcus aquatilis]
MRPLKWLAWSVLLSGGAAGLPAEFPWSSGYLEVGPSFAHPLLFQQDFQAPGPPLAGWSRVPLPLTPQVVWAAQPGVRVGTASLVPGLPQQVSRTWQVPVALTLPVSAPAIVDLGPGLRGPGAVAVHPGLSVPTRFPPGQVFLRVSLDANYRQGGHSLSVPQLNGRVLTLQRLEAGRALFTVAGLGEVERLGSPSRGFPDLAPLIPDPELATLKRTYEGHDVWGYGGLSTSCAPSEQAGVGVEGPHTQALRVQRVARLGTPLSLNVQGGFGSELGHGADAVTLTPLVFLLDAAPFQSDGSFGFSSSPNQPDVSEEELLAQIETAQSPGVCGSTVPIFLMDTWAVPRVFSRTPPTAQVPVKMPEDPTGLTRWQYAWLAGFPSSTFGSLSELLRLSEWQYRNIPFPARVSFDAGGKVKQVEVPRLP